MLSEKIKNKHLILASASPRRHYFLKKLGLEFEVRIKNIKETYPTELIRSEITDYLSKLKAQPFIADLRENEILVTSDTIVWLDNKALGKPENTLHAIQMLNELSGRSHEVISSICISTFDKQVITNERTVVHFKKLRIDEIEYYVNKFKPFDKAGSYGIQEWIGFIGIDKIDGNYSNVMGFPVHKFYEEMMRLF